MATHQIYLNDQVSRKPICNNITFSFNPKSGSLVIYIKDKKFFHCQAKAGDVYVVEHTGKTLRANKLHIPHRRSDIIMSLLGFPSSARAHSLEQFNETLTRQQKRYNCCEKWITGRNNDPFRLTIINTADEPQKIYRIAAYVDGGMDNEHLIYMFNSFPWGFLYPIGFVKNVLLNNLGFTIQEFEKINPKLFPADICF